MFSDLLINPTLPIDVFRVSSTAQGLVMYCCPSRRRYLLTAPFWLSAQGSAQQVRLSFMFSYVFLDISSGGKVAVSKEAY